MWRLDQPISPAVVRLALASALAMAVSERGFAQVTFQPGIVDSGPADVGAHTSIAFRPDNFTPYISYYDATNGDLKFATGDAQGGWLVETVDSRGDVGQFTATVVDVWGRIHVSYYDASNGNLKYALKTGPSWIVRTVDAAVGNVGRHTAISLDSINNPVITYLDTSSGGLKLAYGSFQNSSSWTISWCCNVSSLGRAPVTPNAVMPAMDVVYFDVPSRNLVQRSFDPSASGAAAWSAPQVIAAGTVIQDLSAARWRGAYYVSYTDADAMSISSLYVVSPTGIGWNAPIRIASGRYGSIAIDHTGSPFIAFHSTAGTLQFASRNNGGSWATQAADTSAGVGGFTSLAFNLCGNPHIAYYDGTNGTLKMANARVASGCFAHLTDNGDGTVTDSNTGLMWLRDANQYATSNPGQSGAMTWAQAQQWADALIFAGYDDWRLPLTQQPDTTCYPRNPILTGIVTAMGCRNSEMGHLRFVDGVGSISPGPFLNVQPRGTYYWSATGASPTQAWVHSFFWGEQAPAHATSNAPFAWAVRDIRSRTVSSATGAGSVDFATNIGRFRTLTAVAESSLPTGGKPPGTTFPFGFFSWEIIAVPIGATVTITISYPSDVSSPAAYWKVINGTWTDISSLVGDDDGDAVLTLTINDGGLGDADGVANGTIVDPGGFGLRANRMASVGMVAIIAIVLVSAVLAWLLSHSNMRQARREYK